MNDDPRNGDSGNDGPPRNLADILREAGVSSAGAGGRRRRREDSSDQPDDVRTSEFSVPVMDKADPGPAIGDDFSSLSAYLLSDPATRTPAKPALPVRTPAANGAPARGVPSTDTGPVTPFGWARRTEWPQPTGVQDGSSTESSDVPVPVTPAPVTAALNPVPPSPPTDTVATSHAKRSPSPLASSAPAEDDTHSAVPVRTGAGSWVILAVELLAAIGLGVAAWYAFSALWELLPYVAAFAGPVVVTGLVAVAGALRARTGRNPLGLPTLCMLVLAGTVLVVLPAATVIVP